MFFIFSIDGIPFITRFKTENPPLSFTICFSIEGIPFITRFKTIIEKYVEYNPYYRVLKVFHL